MVLVDTDAICAAIKDVFEDTRSILEPAGALAVAGAKAWAKASGTQGQDPGGGGFRRQHEFRPPALRRRARRTGRTARSRAGRDHPGKARRLKKFCALIGSRNITEFNYRYSDSGEAHVFVGVQVANRSEARKLVALLQKHGLPTLDLTDDEMAKLHVRHLVGGHAPQVKNELLYRFEFPERPGALMNFLNKHERAAGTSACSTTATTAPTTAACWSACKCRRRR